MYDIAKWIAAHLEDTRVILAATGVALDIIYRTATPFSNRWAFLVAAPMCALGAWLMPENRGLGVAFGVIGYAAGLLFGGLILLWSKKHGADWLGLKGDE